MKEAVLPISQLPAPPMQLEPEMLFTERPDVGAVEQRLAGAGWKLPDALREARPRVGRGGRLVFDRQDSASKTTPLMVQEILHIDQVDQTISSLSIQSHSDIAMHPAYEI